MLKHFGPNLCYAFFFVTTFELACNAHSSLFSLRGKKLSFGVPALGEWSQQQGGAGVYLSAFWLPRCQPLPPAGGGGGLPKDVPCPRHAHLRAGEVQVRLGPRAPQSSPIACFVGLEAVVEREHVSHHRVSM